MRAGITSVVSLTFGQHCVITFHFRTVLCSSRQALLWNFEVHLGHNNNSFFKFGFQHTALQVTILKSALYLPPSGERSQHTVRVGIRENTIRYCHENNGMIVQRFGKCQYIIRKFLVIHQDICVIEDEKIPIKSQKAGIGNYYCFPRLSGLFLY